MSRISKFLSMSLQAGAFLLATSFAAHAISEKELAVVEAAELIEIVGQSLAKAYFYKHLGIRVANANKDIDEGMIQLNSSVRVLTENLTDEEEKNILLFMTFTRDEIEETLSLPYSEENGSLMIDFSESLLEGADFIVARHGEENNPDLDMLVTSEKMIYLLERINKYYIAFQAGLNDSNNVQQLNTAVADFESLLGVVNAHQGYPAGVKSSVDKVNKFWPIAKRFYLGIEKGALPVIVLASTNNLEKELHKIEAHHHKTLVGDSI